MQGECGCAKRRRATESIIIATDGPRLWRSFCRCVLPRDDLQSISMNGHRGCGGMKQRIIRNVSRGHLLLSEARSSAFYSAYSDNSAPFPDQPEQAAAGHGPQSTFLLLYPQSQRLHVRPPHILCISCGPSAFAPQPAAKKATRKYELRNHGMLSKTVRGTAIPLSPRMDFTPRADAPLKPCALRRSSSGLPEPAQATHAQNTH